MDLTLQTPPLKWGFIAGVTAQSLHVEVSPESSVLTLWKAPTSQLLAEVHLQRQEVVNFWFSSHAVVTVADNNFLSALPSSPAHVPDIIFCETAVAWHFTHLFPAKANANSQGNSRDNQESWLFPSRYTLLNFFPHKHYILPLWKCIKQLFYHLPLHYPL